MSIIAWLRKTLATAAGAPHPRPGTGSGKNGLSYTAPEMVRNLLTLGNLFRARGDIDRAVRLRENLLGAAADDPSLLAEIHFELGRDYRKAGLVDRALLAYKEARKLGFAEPAVSGELAHLFAGSGDFAAAARESAELGLHRAEAYFLVRQAEENASLGKDLTAQHLLRSAALAFPASPEACLGLVSLRLAAGQTEKAIRHIASCFGDSDDSTRLILLEGLHSLVKSPLSQNTPDAAPAALAKGISELVATHDSDVIVCYYAGLFCRAAKDESRAEQWFTKALVLDPDFWAARLAILTIAAERESLPPLLARQIAFFTEQGARSRRFFCPPCGIRRDTVFSFCPRCRAWHTVAFRKRLT